MEKQDASLSIAGGNDFLAEVPYSGVTKDARLNRIQSMTPFALEYHFTKPDSVIAATPTFTQQSVDTIDRYSAILQTRIRSKANRQILGTTLLLLTDNPSQTIPKINIGDMHTLQRYFDTFDRRNERNIALKFVCQLSPKYDYMIGNKNRQRSLRPDSYLQYFKAKWATVDQTFASQLWYIHRFTLRLLQPMIRTDNQSNECRLKVVSISALHSGAKQIIGYFECQSLMSAQFCAVLKPSHYRRTTQSKL